MIGYKWGKGRLIVYGWPTYSAFVCCALFFAQSSLQLSNTSGQDEKPDFDYYDYMIIMNLWVYILSTGSVIRRWLIQNMQISHFPQQKWRLV